MTYRRGPTVRAGWFRVFVVAEVLGLAHIDAVQRDVQLLGGALCLSEPHGEEAEGQDHDEGAAPDTHPANVRNPVVARWYTSGRSPWGEDT